MRKSTPLTDDTSACLGVNQRGNCFARFWRSLNRTDFFLVDLSPDFPLRYNSTKEKSCTGTVFVEKPDISCGFCGPHSSRRSVLGRTGNRRWKQPVGQVDRALPSGCPGKVLWDVVPEGLGGGDGGAAKPFSGSFGGRLHRPAGRLPNVTARFVRGKWDEKDRALCGRDCFRSYCRGMWGVAWHDCPANGIRLMVNRTRWRSVRTTGSLPGPDSGDPRWVGKVPIQSSGCGRAENKQTFLRPES